MYVLGIKFIIDIIDGIIKLVFNVMYCDRYFYLCLVMGIFCLNMCDGGKMGKGVIYVCIFLLIVGIFNLEILLLVIVMF